ncbi:hypothetical protein Ancab_016158, partial [Ancistrocladus abbreviatus]
DISTVILEKKTKYDPSMFKDLEEEEKVKVGDTTPGQDIIEGGIGIDLVRIEVIKLVSLEI